MYLLHDLLFLSQFESGEKTITTNNSIDSSTGYSIYTYTVQVEDIKKITIDKNEYRQQHIISFYFYEQFT